MPGAVVFTDPNNAPTYQGTDGQAHHYTGATGNGAYTYDPSFPPAALGGAVAGPGSGTGSTASNGQSAAALATQSANNAQAAIGWAAVGIGSLYAAGIIAPPLALIILVSILGFFWLAKAGAAAGRAGMDAVNSAKKYLDDQLNNLGASLGIPKLGDKIAGLVVGGVITILAAGISYYLFRSKDGRITIVEAGGHTRTNPPYRRRMRRIRAKVRTL